MNQKKKKQEEEKRKSNQRLSGFASKGDTDAAGSQIGAKQDRARRVGEKTSWPEEPTNPVETIGVFNKGKNAGREEARGWL